MNQILSQIKEIITNPKEAFSNIEGDIKTSFIQLLIMSVFLLLCQYLISFAQLDKLTSNPHIAFGLSGTPSAVIIGQIVFYFIWSAILFGWFKLWSGTGNYAETYQMAVYSATPSYLFGWIPLIGQLANLWSLGLLIFGASKVHNMSTLKAALIIIIPAFVIFVIIFAIMITAIVLFLGAFGLAATQ